MSNFDCLYLYYISRLAFHFLTWFVFWPGSDLVWDGTIIFSNYFQPLNQKVSIKGQHLVVKDRYNNIYITKGIYFWFYFILLFFVFILQKKKFCFCYSFNSVKVPGSPGKVLELWCKRSWKKWKKVLESPGIWINFFWREPCIYMIKTPPVNLTDQGLN